ncbi:transglutaminase domain-containing protein [Mesoterricola sediminis]|uniref:Transglutaminase-like domain-containing protein n=1 Tax=Mesoterricola sediminis TaxID=2927980 RepID=A0AA48GQ99_9BACT|nr:transglutaminase domain-containing protein [Mesoterricola sediminis]BDU77276.1 hypothetical protein METESE_22340 [Mesoterricola sediminis]
MSWLKPLAPFLATALLGAPALDQLPAWAQGPAACTEAPPADADAWVLLDRTEFTYRGGGEIRLRAFRLVKILTEQGLEARAFERDGLGGAASRIEKLKGWNLRPDGTLVTLDKAWVATVSASGNGELTRDQRTVALLDRVVKGSLVAFESQEVLRPPLGPLVVTPVMGPHPVRTWELAWVKSANGFPSLGAEPIPPRMATWNLPPGFPPPAPDATQIRLEGVPAAPRRVRGAPHPQDTLPWVLVRFQDPALPGSMDGSTWDSIARGTHTRFELPRAPFAPVPEARGLDALRAALRWIQTSIRYRIVYLSPERGWQPATPASVLRNRYGDCKDQAAFLLNAAREAGFHAVPALARIHEGHAEPVQPPSPYAFNHVITAIRLETPSGLPAEVTTPKGRYLLVDPTDAFSPLGRLATAHRGRQVLICEPEGGLWVPVPPDATSRPAVTVALDGQITEGLAFEGTLTLREQEDALGLRSAALEGPGPVEAWVGGHLNLPPGSTWQPVSVDDPMAGNGTVNLVLRLKAPGALRKAGGAWSLAGLGLPRAPWPIQKLGRPRLSAVETGAWIGWSWKAHLKMGGVLAPTGPAASLETPFRKATFQAARAEDGWSLAFTQTCEPRRYDLAHAEEGVRAQREDRARFSQFLEEALTFAVQL